MNRYITIIFIAILFLLNVVPANGQKKSQLKVPFKSQKVEVVDNIQPDPVAHKAKPDKHPKPLEMPRMIFGFDDSNNLHGIDVSHYQGRINWDEVLQDKNAGYVYLKATEGTSIVDDTYQRNFQECKRVGLKVGSYLFFRPQYSAKAQFDLFKSVVDTKNQDLLPLVDAESIRGASVAVFQSRLVELCELLEKEYGTRPMIYSGQNFYNKYIHGISHLRGYKFFIAKYDVEPPILEGDDDYLMWQYSAKGHIRGIRGNVDMSHFMGRHSLREIIYK